MSLTKFSVNLWGSHPDKENDDCWTGRDFDTLEEAEALFNNPKIWEIFVPHNPGYYRFDTAYIQLEGPEIERVRKNPDFIDTSRQDDGEWDAERTWEHRMLYGCDP